MGLQVKINHYDGMETSVYNPELQCWIDIPVFSRYDAHEEPLTPDWFIHTSLVPSESTF